MKTKFEYEGSVRWTLGMIFAGIGLSLMFTDKEMEDIGKAVVHYLEGMKNSKISKLEK